MNDITQDNMKEIMKVRGIAIKPGISKNGIKYTHEELEKFANTMPNRPILKDHNNIVDNTVGLVEQCECMGGIVQYSGWVKEDGSGLLEKIKDGRAKEVSIGAYVGKLVKESDDSDVMVATDMQCMELSITPTPGVNGTSLKQSLECYESDKKFNPILESFDENEIKQEVIQMTEETNVDTATQIQEKAVEIKTEKIHFEVDTSKMDEAIEKASKLLSLKEKLREEIKEEKLECKGKIEKENSEIVNDKVTDYVSERSEIGKGIDLWKMPKSDGSY